MSRKIVEEMLGKRDLTELWGAGYRYALPITPQGFSMGSVLPAVLYMMRWGHRRGKGKFLEMYGNKEGAKTRATISQVASLLSTRSHWFEGFEGEIERAILGDLLLAYCLENMRHKTGREEQVQRVFPTHYFSSWIDLPRDVANLRNVPEMIVAVLARQPDGPTVSREKSRGYYAIGGGFENNLLLALFGDGTSVEGQQDNLKADQFSDEKNVGIDQLLAIRLAQSLGEAPTKVGGENPLIANQWPVAQLASERFYEDFNVFLRAYGKHIPRQSLLPMLESCLSLWMTNINLSTINLILSWADTGSVPSKEDQRAWPLFVDCSASTDPLLRRFSEEQVDDLISRLGRVLVCLVCPRILDQRAQQERLKNLPPPGPDPSERMNFLGNLLFGRLSESKDIERDIRKTCNKLCEALEQAGERQAKQILENEDVHPAWRFAECLLFLMDHLKQTGKYRDCLESCLMLDQPNGLARKRRTVIKGKWVERRSIVLSNTALDFLVHHHKRKAKKGTGPSDLSLKDFVRILRDRYGFYIDEAPPGLSIPSDQLRKNRNHLERRLRDLGLLIGVNDAEAMKRLRQRFEVDDGSN